MTSAIQNIDTLFFYKINAVVGLNNMLDDFFVFVTISFYWLIWILFLLMLILTIDDVSLGKKIKRVIKRPSELKKIDFKLFSVVVISSGASYLFSQLIGWLASRQRPFIELADVVKLIFDPVSNKSFPSDHTVMSFAIALSVFYLHKKWGAFFIILAALIGFSRIYVGVHYPLDVLAGFLLAWIVSYVVNRLLRR